MRVLVLQLARLGDILQTLPALQALKKSSPDCEITLVARQRFAGAAAISPHADRVLAFPSAHILGPYAAAPSEDAKSISLDRLAEWVRESFAGPPFDLLLNLTFSEASAYLATIIPATERRGLYVARDGAVAASDAWSQYFYAQVLQKNLNILHLNDLFCRIAGTSAGAWPLEIHPSVPTWPGELGPRIAGSRRRIGIQMTASQAEKTPSIATWSKICSRLIATGSADELVFFGASQDVPAIEAALDLAPEIRDRSVVLAGKLRFHENVAWVKACEAVVSPDTALAHLSSICGTRVICIPLGGVRPEETGPYGEGHCVLYPSGAEPEEYADAVARVARGEPAGAKVAQSVTRLVPCSDGSMRSELAPENFAVDETANLFLQSYYLLAELRGSGRVEEIPVPRIGGTARSPGALDRLLLTHEALLSVRRTAEFGRHFCLEMLGRMGDAESLKELSAKLAEVDALLDEVRATIPLVKPLLDGWKVRKANVDGQTLEDLIGLTEGTYRELIQNVDVVLQLLEAAVKTAHERVGTEGRAKPIEGVNP